MGDVPIAPDPTEGVAVELMRRMAKLSEQAIRDMTCCHKATFTMADIVPRYVDPLKFTQTFYRSCEDHGGRGAECSVSIDDD